MRRVAACALSSVLLAAVLTLVSSTTPASAADEGPEFREIQFPVDGVVSFSDDYGDPRSGGRVHEGNDLMGARMMKLTSAVDGVVTSAKIDASNLSGNMLTIKDADGWTYRYMHINNDTPGTDDGLGTSDTAFAPGIVNGTKVKVGQLVAFMGDSGNAETTSPHLHFEVHHPDGTPIDPWTSLRLAKGLPAGTRCSYGSNPKAAPNPKSGAGYYVLGNDGGIFSFGNAPFLGSVPGLNLGPKVTALRLAATKSGLGYHILGADGGIFTFGDAAFLGSVPGLNLGVKVQALDLQRTASGKGYWILGADGGVFSFGDADFYGSVPGLGITSAKALRLVPTPTGKGYWVLGADGGVFSFGDAEFAGSVPGLGLTSKVVAMAPAAGTPVKPATKTTAAVPATPGGYWVLAEDGGVFSFNATFEGSIPGAGLCAWPKGVQMAPTGTGNGYWVVGDEGSVFSFGDAAKYGDVAGLGLKIKAVDLAVVPAVAK